MKRFQVVSTMAAVVGVVLANVAGAQMRLPPSDPSHPIDRNTKDYEISPDVLWKALIQSYREAGIKATSVDPSTYQISYLATPAGPKVGNAKIENVLDCGGDKKAPLARTLALAVTVRSQVIARGNGSTLKTFVDAIPVGTPADSVTAPVCNTRFVLEKKLEPQVKFAFRVVGVGVAR